MSDAINPSHYKSSANVECFEIARLLSFELGNALKYVWRAGRKDPETAAEDLKKALWYLNRAKANAPSKILKYPREAVLFIADLAGRAATCGELARSIVLGSVDPDVLIDVTRALDLACVRGLEAEVRREK